MQENQQEINKEALKFLSNFDENSPVFMMNYLHYKELVSSTGKSGKETKKRLGARCVAWSGLRAGEMRKRRGRAPSTKLSGVMCGHFAC